MDSPQRFTSFKNVVWTEVDTERKTEKVEVNVIETLEKVIDVPVVKQVEVPQAWP